MYLRLLSVLILVVAFSGCASTQLKQQNEQLESRVTDLEKNSQTKDSEIVDLQYQVKDLSSKMDASKPSEDGDQAAVVPSTDVVPETMPDEVNKDQIIRVKASPEKIQRALKSAGVYTGPIDGKIGAGTREAIVEFQKTHGLKADGVLGKRTWDYLKKYLK